jgi:DNA-binding CsgD family transcriptional regulator
LIEGWIMGSTRESVKRVNQSALCAFALNEQNRIVAWSKAAVAALGWTAKEAVGQVACNVIEGKDIFGNRWCPQYCGLREMAERREPIQTVWLQLKKKDGSYVQFFGDVHAVPANDGSPGAGRDEKGADLLFELQEERRRQTAGALIERLLYRQIGYPPPVTKTQDGGELPRLTTRQKEVLSLLAEGLEPARIAPRLGVSVNTVRNHIQRILFNLECHSQANAVAIAIRQGLI